MSISLAKAHHGGAAGRPPVWLRGRVWLRRSALKRALATGADPNSSPELARYAQQLTSLRCRRTLATGLERIVRAAEQPARLSPAVPVQRRDVLAARGELERLADDLVAPGEVQARGVVLVQRLLTDGESPFFKPSPPGELDLALRHAHAALLLR